MVVGGSALAGYAVPEGARPHITIAVDGRTVTAELRKRLNKWHAEAQSAEMCAIGRHKVPQLSRFAALLAWSSTPASSQVSPAPTRATLAISRHDPVSFRV